MFFKRLEIHGFKSFGHKTTIDFQEGFTIIVGPNGCGKSNVLDSIRWVLGTQSAKSLRGEKMGDVIFRGSQSTKAAGLATVSLICSNEAGLLKMEESEVEITRRLFTNGESEYKINKRMARMRDIQDLFLDTGLGAEGYSIIEQNQIGQMVAAKPRERRDVFEEAAGISRYKLRREEALRKLIRTSEDLIRLEDLVREVERQCNTLKNQARKALRFRKATRRLRRLTQRLFVMRHDELTVRAEGANQRFQQAQNAFEEASAQCSSAEARSVQFQAELDQAQTSLQDFQQAQFQLRSKRDAQKHQMELIQNRLKATRERLESIDREWQSRKSRLAVLGSTLESLQAEFEEEKRAHEAGAVEFHKESDRLAQLRNRTSSATHTMAEKQTRLRQLEQRERVLENDYRVATSLVERLMSELTGTDSALEQVRAQAESAESAAKAASEKLVELRTQHAALVEEARSLKERIDSDDSAKKEMARDLDALSKETGRISSRRHALQELEDSFEGYFQGVKEVMKANDKGQLKGMIGVVTSLIEVPKELELAVEVALGGDMQDIVTHTVEQAKQAIQFLKDRKLGRATFLPLDNLHTDFPLGHLKGIWGRRGVLGLGKDLVKYDPLIENAVAYLFSNTVFVEELDVAIALSREGVRNRFVSLSGDVANPRGVLSGGSHQSRGLLTRQREIRQLQDEQTALEQRLKTLQAKVAETNERLSGLYGRAAEVQNERHKLDIAIANSQKDFDQAERERRERRNQLAQADARRTQQTVDLQKHQEVAARSSEGMQEVKTLLENARLELAQTESENSALVEEFRNASERVAVLREQQNRGAQAIQVTERRLQEMRNSLVEADRENAIRQREQADLEAVQQQGLVDLEEAENTLQELLQEVEIAERRVAARLQENEVLQQSFRQHQNQTQHLFRNRQEKENIYREAEVQAAELNAQLGYLEREVEDEFALTIADVRREMEAEIAAEQAALQGKPSEAVQPSPAESASEPAPAPEATEREDEESVDFSLLEGPATTPEDEEADTPQKLRLIVNELKQKIQRMGAVNEEAIEEYKTQSERFQFLTTQRNDVVEAKKQLEESIAQIDATTTQMFHDALNQIRTNFQVMYKKLFNGGEADLILVEDEKHPEPGIDIYAQPPGKKIGGSITLLSGGEKALTAIALMFALFQYRPSPICILDEIDAPLDDVNCARMCSVLKEYARDTQFLIITHNKITMGLADTIYGVTMQEAGASKVVSVKFEDVDGSGLLETAKG